MLQTAVVLNVGTLAARARPRRPVCGSAAAGNSSRYYCINARDDDLRRSSTPRHSEEDL